MSSAHNAVSSSGVVPSMSAAAAREMLIFCMIIQFWFSLDQRLNGISGTMNLIPFQIYRQGREGGFLLCLKSEGCNLDFASPGIYWIIPQG